jgi:hypothetical protein
MAEMKKLVLGHMFLYAKGWYRRTDTLWEGYLRAICCDGIYTPTNMSEVAWIMYHTLIEHKEELLGKRDDYDMYIFDGISRKMDDLTYGYLYGKTVEGLKPNAVYSLAVIWFCHGVFSTCSVEVFDKVLMASNKVLPLNKDMQYGPKTNKECYERMLKMYGNRPTPLCNKPYNTEYSLGKSTYNYYKHCKTLYSDIKRGEIPYKGRKC